ncbi:hypothetical protein [Streptomyces yangpuensis]|uniref:hypothetical protein n=1 Tax=Streptomyces yangpuensis TaxID=1648182 RepID=UPI0036575F3B
MRLTIRAPGREIDIEVGQNSAGVLKQAEATALRLLQALPADPAGPDKAPFGFSVDSDAERAEPAGPEAGTDHDA